jgi:(2Fe-2S) ferredoxin
MDKDEKKKLERKSRRRGIAVRGDVEAGGGYTRHILLCTGPQCCAPEEGEAAWKELNWQLKELRCGGANVYASRVGCLFFCQRGPLAIVYPEGTWYAHADAEGVVRIAREHLAEGRVVEDLAFARNPLVVPREEEGKEA